MVTPSERDFYRDKILQLDRPVDHSLLRKYLSPWRFLRPAFWRLFKYLTRYLSTKGVGVENIPRKGPFILAANHTSSLDYGLVGWLLPEGMRKDVYVMAWEGFFRFPHFYISWGIKITTDCFPMDPKGDYLRGLREAARLLRLGKIVYLNPEGNRTSDGEMLPFKFGLGFLACELGVPVVPIYIKGAFEALRPKTAWLKKVPTTVYFGKPVVAGKISDADQRPKMEIYQDFSDRARQEVIKLKEIASPSLRSGSQ